MLTAPALRRLALGGAVLLLGATAPGIATGSQARSAAVATPEAPQARGGSPQSTVDRVADFYGAYIDILFDSGRGRLSHALRNHYLTPELRHTLARWEAAHHKDGVLRATGVPTAWKVVYNDSGMGHCWSRVTLTWKVSENHIRHTHLMVQSDIATRLISDLKIGK